MKETNLKRKKTGLILIGAIVLIICVITVITVLSNSTAKRLQDQIQLGEKYLNELNYEQAIASYRAAIQIDPKCVEAYLGLADAYIGSQELDTALVVLRDGYEQTGENRIADRILEVEEMLTEASKEQIDNEELSLKEEIDSHEESEDVQQEDDEMVSMLVEAEYAMDEMDFKQSLEIYTAVLEMEPLNVDAFLGIVEIYIRQGDYDTAFEYAQKGYDLTGDTRLNEKIDMIKTGTISDSRGNVSKKIYHDENGDIIYWNILTYDGNNTKTITVYDANGKQIDFGEFVYNENGSIITEYYNRMDGVLNKIEYIRDEKDRITKQMNTYKDGRTSISDYFYHDEEELYYKTTYSEYVDGEIIAQGAQGSDIYATEEYTVYQRNNTGEIIEWNRYTESDVLFGSGTIDYDENDKKIRQDSYTYNLDGSIAHHNYYIFVYDSDGDMTMEQHFLDGKLFSETNYK